MAKHDDKNHAAQLAEHNIEPIQLVCVNLYPFQATISKPEVTVEDAIENIDIGGPTMLRSSAKNHEYVTVIVDSNDYPTVLAELKQNGGVSKTTNRRLAAKVFRHTAAYDAVISEYMTELADEENPESLTVTYELKQSLRYGENPHQKAAFYKNRLVPFSRLQKRINYMEKNFHTTTLMMLMQHFKSLKNSMSRLQLQSNI